MKITDRIKAREKYKQQWILATTRLGLHDYRLIAGQSMLGTAIFVLLATDVFSQPMANQTGGTTNPTVEKKERALTLDRIFRIPIDHGQRGYDQIANELVRTYQLDPSKEHDRLYGKDKYVELADGYIVTHLSTNEPSEYFRIDIAKKPCFTTERAALAVGPHTTIIGVHSEAMYFSATRGSHVDFTVPSQDYKCVASLSMRKLHATRAKPETLNQPDGFSAPTIENLLTLPLKEGRYGLVKATEMLHRLYGFDSSRDGVQNAHYAAQLLDGFNLDVTTIYDDENLITIDVGEKPCFPIERAIAITDAKESPQSPREYKDVRLYYSSGSQATVEFASSYSNYDCLATISIRSASKSSDLTKPKESP